MNPMMKLLKVTRCDFQDAYNAMMIFHESPFRLLSQIALEHSFRMVFERF